MGYTVHREYYGYTGAPFTWTVPTQALWTYILLEGAWSSPDTNGFYTVAFYNHPNAPGGWIAEPGSSLEFNIGGRPDILTYMHDNYYPSLMATGGGYNGGGNGSGGDVDSILYDEPILAGDGTGRIALTDFQPGSGGSGMTTCKLPGGGDYIAVAPGSQGLAHGSWYAQEDTVFGEYGDINEPLPNGGSAPAQGLPDWTYAELVAMGDDRHVRYKGESRPSVTEYARKIFLDDGNDSYFSRGGTSVRTASYGTAGGTTNGGDAATPLDPSLTFGYTWGVNGGGAGYGGGRGGSILNELYMDPDPESSFGDIDASFHYLVTEGASSGTALIPYDRSTYGGYEYFTDLYSDVSVPIGPYFSRLWEAGRTAGLWIGSSAGGAYDQSDSGGEDLWNYPRNLYLSGQDPTNTMMGFGAVGIVWGENRQTWCIDGY